MFTLIKKFKVKTGEDALINYQQICQKGIKKTEKYNIMGKQIKNPLLTYMNAVDNQKQSPRAFGLVHRKKGNEINISSFYLSDKYVDAFSKGINLSKQVHKLNLSRNQLTSNTVIKICLKDNSTLRFLNLSKNDINFNGAYYLGELLKDNSTLSVLFLHWNKLQAKGGQYIALALQVNNTLQILDLSFCALGNGRENFENIMKNAMKTKNNLRSSINLAELSTRNINFGQGIKTQKK